MIATLFRRIDRSVEYTLFLFFLAFQKLIIRGVAMSGLKG